ncbi:STAS domain-containing protein [Streptacidiphilus sp. ASG 303]|uniref:STAS domain-containing protein n=1 Tax=Streptacidiphilus sp. ASG 303 TaxID=2896847 RepID=UPI001E44680A|nr:STAS domain-containing protein [Streptacidiphilus sp. ASG 303]MCD0482093.1 STAS domain-containing protein [Streptacidiphilus sp. ASG 303]
MVLAVTSEERDGWTVLRVAGEIDLVSAATVRTRVHEAVAEGRRRLVLDLSEVQFCDSSGVGVLIAARRLMRSCAGELRLAIPGRYEDGRESRVQRVFNALGVRRLFDIHPDADSAVAAPPGSGGGRAGQGAVPLSA